MIVIIKLNRAFENSTLDSREFTVSLMSKFFTLKLNNIKIRKREFTLYGKFISSERLLITVWKFRIVMKKEKHIWQNSLLLFNIGAMEGGTPIMVIFERFKYILYVLAQLAFCFSLGNFFSATFIFRSEDKNTKFIGCSAHIPIWNLAIVLQTVTSPSSMSVAIKPFFGISKFCFTKILFIFDFTKITKILLTHDFLFNNFL